MRRLPIFAITILQLVSFISAQLDFSSSQYQSQSRLQKLGQLWSTLTADTSSGSFPQGNLRACFFFESMKVTFNLVSDQMPAGRIKEIHGVGVVAQIQYVPLTPSPYTGFFKGADSMIIRFSVTAQPNTTNPSPTSAQGNFFPGFALKYLIDGKPSANIFAMLNTGAISSWNFFATDISNHVFPPPLGTKKKFSTASIYPQTIGMLSLSTFQQDGTLEANPVFPWKLLFKATPALKALYPDNFELSFVDQIIQGLSPGQVVYEVYAQDTPSSTNEVLIGNFVIGSQPTTSKFGDEGLFFQHHQMEQDLNVHPDWESSTPKFTFCTFRNIEEFDGPCPFTSP